MKEPRDLTEKERGFLKIIGEDYVITDPRAIAILIVVTLVVMALVFGLVLLIT